jgi:hypothetical protein
MFAKAVRCPLMMKHCIIYERERERERERETEIERREVLNFWKLGFPKLMNLNVVRTMFNVIPRQ